MNRFVVNKDSLVSLIKHTVDDFPGIRLHIRRLIGRLNTQPIRIRFTSRTSVSVRAEIEVRFGENIIQTVDQTSKQIAENLQKMAAVQARTVELIVKDVYYETKSDS